MSEDPATAPTAPEPTLDELAEARRMVEGRTPAAVLDAFLPKKTTAFGKTLVPLTAGHELLLGQLGHPLATGEPLDDSDCLLALFIFSHRSATLFELLAGDEFNSEFFRFLDTLPAGVDPQALGSDLISHWLSGRATALAMESRGSGSAQKKTADSAGC